jgi:hypothetical protein
VLSELPAARVVTLQDNDLSMSEAVERLADELALVGEAPDSVDAALSCGQTCGDGPGATDTTSVLSFTALSRLKRSAYNSKYLRTSM